MAGEAQHPGCQRYSQFQPTNSSTCTQPNHCCNDQDESLKEQEDSQGFTPLATAAEVRPIVWGVCVCCPTACGSLDDSKLLPLTHPSTHRFSTMAHPTSPLTPPPNPPHVQVGNGEIAQLLLDCPLSPSPPTHPPNPTASLRPAPCPISLCPGWQRGDSPAAARPWCRRQPAGAAQQEAHHGTHGGYIPQTGGGAAEAGGWGVLCSIHGDGPQSKPQPSCLHNPSSSQP